ncbi:unnamed protein product [Meloidogyne enterolobii]|uniref:Uncharacterized protein n=1 Tax=Meloidogyne enterolobii TaxID=390850 RepID=A0ACB1AND1_MELEN
MATTIDARRVSTRLDDNLSPSASHGVGSGRRASGSRQSRWDLKMISLAKNFFKMSKLQNAKKFSKCQKNIKTPKIFHNAKKFFKTTKVSKCQKNFKMSKISKRQQKLHNAKKFFHNAKLLFLQISSQKTRHAFLFPLLILVLPLNMRIFYPFNPFHFPNKRKYIFFFFLQLFLGILRTFLFTSIPLFLFFPTQHLVENRPQGHAV